ncbi:MAG TPA: hypothetical protein ENG69_02570 [Candidatus Korarchaeota archaeon]|nr:hypothetical protein [Candidatus Korarchaeota archaeon]
MLLGESRISLYAKAAVESGDRWTEGLLTRPTETYDEIRALAARGDRRARSVLERVPPPPPPPQTKVDSVVEDLGPALLAFSRGRVLLVPKSWLHDDRAASAAALGEYLRGRYPPGAPRPDVWDVVSYRAKIALKMLGGGPYDLALEAAVRSTKLWPILILLLGIDVTEVYGSLGSPVYVDHVVAGRLVVENLRVDEVDFERIRSLAEIHPHGGVGYARPMTKVDVELSGRRVRLAVDVPPAATPCFDARNLAAMSRLPLPRLVTLGTLSMEEAAFILQQLSGGTPVLVAGPTASGKTTLCNALLALSDPSWRIVSVEEVREIEDLREYGLLHHAYSISGARTDAVIALLHRNPDLVFLGEILNREHAEAFAFAADSGFRVLATTHASDRRGLLRKWRAWRLLEALDGTLIVLMRERRVLELGTISGGSWDRLDPAPSPEYETLLRSLLGASTNREAVDRLRGEAAWVRWARLGRG